MCVVLTAFRVHCYRCYGFPTFKELINGLQSMTLNVCPFHIIICLRAHKRTEGLSSQRCCAEIISQRHAVCSTCGKYLSDCYEVRPKEYTFYSLNFKEDPVGDMLSRYQLVSTHTALQKEKHTMCFINNNYNLCWLLSKVLLVVATLLFMSFFVKIGQ